MKILVLAGGLSNERNVSLASGAMVTNALRKKGHKTALVDLFMGIDDDDSFELLSNKDVPAEWVSVALDAPNIKDIINSRTYPSASVFGKNVLKICQEADIVFIALHGGCGENGEVQATLDMLGIPYTGSDYLASAIAMNKDLAKELVSTAGVRTPEWKRIYLKNEAEIDCIVKETEIPGVVKIPDSGSSVGVYIAKSEDELKNALKDNVGNTVLLEKFVSGREIQMAFLNGRPLPSIEIVANSEFYNYKSKYQKGIAAEVSPADISKEQELEMGELLMKVVCTLGLRTYSRADFIIDGEGKIWFIEINSLPGMTSTSLVPQEAKAAGIGFEALCEKIVEDGITRKVGILKYYE